MRRYLVVANQTLGEDQLVELIEKRVFSLAEVGTYTVGEWKELVREAGFTASNIAPGPIWWFAARAEVFVEAWA